MRYVLSMKVERNRVVDTCFRPRKSHSLDGRISVLHRSIEELGQGVGDHHGNEALLLDLQG